MWLVGFLCQLVSINDGSTKLAQDLAHCAFATAYVAGYANDKHLWEL